MIYWKLKITHLKIEVNVTAIMHFMTIDEVTNIHLSSLIVECWMLVHNIIFKSPKHIFRERNKCADTLVRLENNFQFDLSITKNFLDVNLIWVCRTLPSSLISVFTNDKHSYALYKIIF